MGTELDLLAKYPRGKRDPAARALEKTAEDIAIARSFGREFFDGKRRHGYGGYSAAPERWKGVMDDLQARYGSIPSILDVGCAKGGLLREFKNRHPDLYVAGVDVSEYAVELADKDLHCQVADCRELPFGRKVFSLVVSINTIHNLDRTGCIQALQEIERVGERAYVTVDSFRNDEERSRMFDWNLTAQTILSTDEWKALFAEAGYTGDYGWWVP